MISRSYKRHFQSLSDNESWEEYYSRLKVTDEPNEKYFIKHVIFDHYEAFVDRFPWFEFNSVDYRLEAWKAEIIDKRVKYDNGKELDFWYDHLVSKPDPRLTLLQFMIDESTWPLPIVLFDFSENLEFLSIREKLTQFHLIEGTHRVSYLKKMLIDGVISHESKHKVLVLRKRIT